MSDLDQVKVRHLDVLDYEPTWAKMKAFTESRGPETQDEIWLLQHNSVFTQGQAGKEEHVLMPGDIPIVQVDRGGQVTYHGPGQSVVYLMVDLRRRKLGVRDMVTLMEESLIELLADRGVTAFAKPDAPGVYVGQAKIASLGLRVRRGCTFHGLALNVSMDLEPFLRINPCGYAGMPMTDMSTLLGTISIAKVQLDLLTHIIRKIGYTSHSLTHSLEN